MNLKENLHRAARIEIAEMVTDMAIDEILSEDVTIASVVITLEMAQGYLTEPMKNRIISSCQVGVERFPDLEHIYTQIQYQVQNHF